MAGSTKTVQRQSPKAVAASEEFGLHRDSMTILEKRNAISGYDLKHRIEALVAGVAKKRIKHIYQGNGAATNREVMILPRIPATSLFPMRHVRVLLGYTAHEICHQLSTDFGLLDSIISGPGTDKRKQQVKEFWNAIEDYRIEKLVKDEYPGFHTLIDDVRDFTTRRFVDWVDAGQYPETNLSNPYAIGAVALTWTGAELNGYRTRAPREALNKLEDNLRQWVESWTADMAAVLTCADARDLAVRIVDELEQQNQNQSGGGSDDEGSESSEKQKSGKTDSDKDKGQQPGQNQSNGDGKTQPDDTKPDGDQDGDKSSNAKPSEDDEENNEPNNGNTNDSDDSSNADQTSDAPGNQDGKHDDPTGDQDEPQNGGGQGQSSNNKGKNGSGSESSNPQTDGAPGDTEHGEAPRPKLNIPENADEAEPLQADLDIKELAEAINSLLGTEAATANTHDDDGLANAAGQGETIQQVIEQGQQRYSELRREVGGPAARAAGIMRRLLQSRDRVRWKGGREEGSLDFNRLVPMTRGANDVYRERNQSRSVNTALSVLLDNSGSMSGHPLTVCQKTAIVLDMAITGTPTEIEISGFTDNGLNPVIYRYRSFGQKAQSSSASLGNMNNLPLGGTPVSTPLLDAWRRLQQRKEPRRIMIIVSDGGANYDDVKPSREAHDLIKEQGCLIFGIAIGTDNEMKKWCDNVIAIDDVDELPQALTALVQEAMR